MYSNGRLDNRFVTDFVIVLSICINYGGSKMLEPMHFEWVAIVLPEYIRLKSDCLYQLRSEGDDNYITAVIYLHIAILL